jgi:hypothetical protein
MIARSRLRIGAKLAGRDDLPHGGFGHGADGRLGIAQVEQEQRRVEMFQTTSKSMSTMFSSVVSIRPSDDAPGRLVPIEIEFSRVTASTSAVTSGQGAKFRPGLPMDENSPRNSSTDCSSGRTV